MIVFFEGFWEKTRIAHELANRHGWFFYQAPFRMIDRQNPIMDLLKSIKIDIVIDCEHIYDTDIGKVVYCYKSERPSPKPVNRPVLYLNMEKGGLAYYLVEIERFLGIGRFDAIEYCEFSKGWYFKDFETGKDYSGFALFSDAEKKQEQIIMEDLYERTTS